MAFASALAILTVIPPAFATTSATTPGATVTSNTPGALRAVTLITGDRVTVTTAADGTETKQVEGPDGESIGFKINKVGKDTYVYPDSTLPYVSAGLLDKDLFNVTRLLADGYDDAHADRLPLIVTYTDAAAGARTQAVPSGAARVRALSSIQGAALTEERSRSAGFWSALTSGAGARTTGAAPVFTGGIAKIWLDGKVKADLADTTAQIGAPQVWAAGNTGTGVDVAVLDTGVDTGHPDLAGRIAETASFVPDEDVSDYHGHGTHVASTIAGTGAASGGTEKGVAPGADLHIGKVLDNAGSGQDSWIIAGMEWAARDQHAKIISMSLGGGPTDGTDPMSQAVNTLSAETGVLFTIAAGNAGPNTVGTPGAADAALTVGAVDGSDQLADFSSQGPRAGDYGLKPELTAPGVDVLAARSQYAPEGEGFYQTLSGTSMATPHVAGAAALLAAAHPDWTGPQLKDALVSSTKATPDYTPYEAGSGRLDAAAAVRNTVFATGSAYSGFHTWPHEPGEKSTKEVTYTNTADTPVTLDLAINAPQAPQGVFTLSATRVTVPAHGTGKVALTANLDKMPLDSHYSGMVDASGADGKVLAHTLIGAGKENERYNLTITAKDRSGEPLSGQLFVAGKKLFESYGLGASGTGSLRMPAGTYAVWLEADVQGTHGPHSLGVATLSAPEIILDRDRAVTLDASKARQVTAVTPQKTTDSQIRLDTYRSFGPDDSAGSSQLPRPEYDSMWALPTGKKVTRGEFLFGARWRKEEPMLTVDAGRRSFDDLRVQRASTPLPEGRMKLDTVFAGQGAEADFAGLRAQGKAAVVRRNDAVTVEQQAASAVKAGARLLLVVNDGIGRLQPWTNPIWAPPPPAPVTVATLTHDEGEELIAQIQRGRTPLTLVSSPTTDYLYDFVRHYDGAVPADPTYRPEKHDLARVDVSFRNYQQDSAIEYRRDVWQGVAISSSISLEAPAQGERTDWVSADADIQWQEQALLLGEIQESAPVGRYRAGTTSDVHWFGPIQRPRLGVQAGLPTRQDDAFYVTVPGWGDSGGDHVGGTVSNPEVMNTLTLYQGDTLLQENYFDWIEVGGLGAERLPYRLISENSRGTWANPYSTGTRTEWGFTSAAGDPGTAAVLPLIQLDYKVDTDPAGRARRNADLAVTPSHLPGGPSSKAINALTLDISYDDGVTWQKADLTHAGDGWRTRLHASARATYVTLRVTAHDGRGNSVTQNITRAFGLK
ncbi:S8 family serine peptidase [Streptosporangium sp. 'caverna']|uniref:S8 family serine peptidase n=1 Tax=Streptosporangium sp. 'caverna' TaxID=2202249 RepID=UPI000D7D638B|nr:S8 family serine peptidase [Streptosporangium sp. 'caverna']AWS46113.1 serine protease [Streptosporangium sp. 'caverna']